MNLNASIYYVAEALENAEYGDEIDVWDKDVVMRGIDSNEMDERNIERNYISDHVCSLTKNKSTITLNFHDSIQEDDIVFGPSEPHGTDPKEINETLRIVLLQVEYMYNIIEWELASINAQSMGHDGFLADYGIEFETLI